MIKNKEIEKNIMKIFCNLKTYDSDPIVIKLLKYSDVCIMVQAFDRVHNEEVRKLNKKIKALEKKLEKYDKK